MYTILRFEHADKTVIQKIMQLCYHIQPDDFDKADTSQLYSENPEDLTSSITWSEGSFDELYATSQKKIKIYEEVLRVAHQTGTTLLLDTAVYIAMENAPGETEKRRLSASLFRLLNENRIQYMITFYR